MTNIFVYIEEDFNPDVYLEVWLMLTNTNK
jgi:hypothetical protein